MQHDVLQYIKVYTLEVKQRVYPWKVIIPTEKYSSKHQFAGSLLVFGGVIILL